MAAEVQPAVDATTADMPPDVQPGTSPVQTRADVMPAKAGIYTSRERDIRPRTLRPKEEGGENEGGDDRDEQRIPLRHSRRLTRFVQVATVSC